MDYIKHYTLLIQRARGRSLSGYYEVHHIIPKCLGGTDEKSNLVDLTPEEHFLAHILLAKIHNHPKLWTAVHMMTVSPDGKTRCNNKMVGWLRRKFSEARSKEMTGKPSLKKGKPMSEEQKKKLSIALKGRKLSDAHRAKMSENRKGQKKSLEHCAKNF